jgi:cell division protein FtsL
MNKPAILLSSLIFAIIVLLGVRTVISNDMSTAGVRLGEVEESLSSYKTENTMLKEKIFTLSSLSHVSSKAAKMGFVESKSNLAISKAMPIALKR